jgi:hypothetical protein
VRARASQTRREAGLRRLGVRVVRVRHAAPARDSEMAPGEGGANGNGKTAAAAGR